MYEAADAMLGHLVKVTPSSKVVGDLRCTWSVPAWIGRVRGDPAGSTSRFAGRVLQGETRRSTRRMAEPFRTKALRGRTHKPPMAGCPRETRRSWPPTRADAEPAAVSGRTRSSPLRRNYGDLSVLPTVDYLYGWCTAASTSSNCGPACSSTSAWRPPASPTSGHAHGRHDHERPTPPVAGPRPDVDVDVPQTERADPGNPDHVAAPFSGSSPWAWRRAPPSPREQPWPPSRR